MDLPVTFSPVSSRLRRGVALLLFVIIVLFGACVPSPAHAADGGQPEVTNAMYALWGSLVLQVVASVAAATWVGRQRRLIETDEMRFLKIERAHADLGGTVRTVDERLTRTREEMAHKEDVDRLGERIERTREEMATKSDMQRLEGKLDAALSNMARRDDLEKVNSKVERVIDQNTEILALIASPANPISPKVR